jgi:hypothetical protein
MRKVLPVIAVLAVALAIGCSRQPLTHLGAWERTDDDPTNLTKDTIHFLEGDKFQVVNLARVRIPGGPSKDLSPIVSEGRYKFDYSKKPIQLDWTWDSGETKKGIVRFIGAESQQMQVCLSSKERPSSFSDNTCYFLTKRDKR